MSMHTEDHSPEAKARRAQREAWRKNPSDPLRARERSAKFWKEANKTNPHYGLVHSRTFFRHPGFRDRLLPRTRAHIEAKARGERQRYHEELRESARLHALAKALSKAGPMPLFEDVAA